MNTHSCIKCSTSYQDEDVEAYYCASCLEEKQKIAAQIDAQMKSRPQKEHKSGLQIYDESPKGPGGFIITRLS